MKSKLALSFFSFVLLGPSLHAESLCVKCLSSAKEEARKCLEAAISQEDKTSCVKKQEVKSKTCEAGQCKIEQAAESGNKSEVATQKNVEER